MNNDKLQSLLSLGLDERTPPNEALNALRAAAKHWQDAAPRAPNDEEIRRTTTKERLMEVFTAEYAQVKQIVFDQIDKSYRDKLNQLEQERDAARTDRDHYRAKLGDVQRHVKAIIGFASESTETKGNTQQPKPFASSLWNNGPSLLDLDVAMAAMRSKGRG